MRKTRLATLVASTFIAFSAHAQQAGNQASPPTAQSPRSESMQMSDQQFAQKMRETEQWLLEAEAELRNDRPQQALQLLNRSSQQVRSAMQTAGDRWQPVLTSMSEKIEQARQAIERQSPDRYERLALARTATTAFNADARARLLIDVPRPQVSVQQASPNVRVEQATPQVQVDQGRPQVTVRQPAPQVNVQMPQPTITIDMPRPEIVVSMPDPDVAVSMQQPQVTVDQALPTVRVEQGRPRVGLAAVGEVDNTRALGADAQRSLQPADARVSVQQAQPNVKVLPGEQAQVSVDRAKPQINYETAEPQVQFSSEGRPNVQFRQTGEPQVTIRRMSADETRQAAAQNAGPRQMPRVEAAGGEELLVSPAVVVLVQEELVRRGYQVGEPDGKLNDRTRQALMKFQEAERLEPTGTPDVRTISALDIDTRRVPVGEAGAVGSQRMGAAAGEGGTGEPAERR